MKGVTSVVRRVILSPQSEWYISRGQMPPTYFSVWHYNNKHTQTHSKLENTL